MRLIKLLIAAALAAALLVVPAGVLAKSRDRDHDRMPDKWEKRHHLNTRVNDARRDPDHDGLSNRSEFRHGTDPRKADTDDDGINDENEIEDHTNPRSDDSDDDGVRDADELSGTIVSFQNGVLTIQLPGDGAGQVSGTVNDATVIDCDDDDDAQAPAATTSRDGSDDNSGPGSGGDDNSGPGSGDDQGDDNDDQGEDQDDDRNCTAADLTPGTRVHEAKLTKATDNSNVFTKIELVPAA
jgi:hypothetical protein